MRWLFLLLLIAVPLPEPASHPSPKPDAIHVSRTPVLSWDGDSHADTFIVSWAPRGKLDEPGALHSGRVFAKQPPLTLPTLPSGWLFEWRVDTVTKEGITVGPKWSFTVK